MFVRWFRNCFDLNNDLVEAKEVRFEDLLQWEPLYDNGSLDCSAKGIC